MLKNLKINTRFTLLLVLVFLVGSLAGGISLWNILTRRAQNQITNQGLVLISLMNSVRDYTTTQVTPLLSDKQAQSKQFLPETVPAYSARTVFDGFRNSSDQGNASLYLYKEAATNPTNTRDLADPFEANLQKEMQNDPFMTQVSGYRELNGQQVFYIARPLRVTLPGCLDCHTSPDSAPKQLVATYGRDHGFGWKLDQVIAIQAIYVPAGEVQTVTLQSFLGVMGIFTVIFALVILLINMRLRQDVIRPIYTLSSLADKVGSDELTNQDLHRPDLTRVVNRRDELGMLAQVFARMVNEVQARTQSLKSQLQKLQIEVDEVHRKSQVQEIVETEFFKDLQSRARSMRQARHSAESGPQPGASLPTSQPNPAKPDPVKPDAAGDEG
jgi:methyl-accepting chemotaxis protein